MGIQTNPCWGATVAAWHFRPFVLFFEFALSVIFHSPFEQVPLKLPISLDTFCSPASARRVKKAHVRAPTPWASGGGRSLPPGLLPCPVPSSRVTLPPWPLAKMKGLASGLWLLPFFWNVCQCVWGWRGEGALPSMLTVTQCVISGSYSTRFFFYIKIQEPRKAAQG